MTKRNFLVDCPTRANAQAVLCVVDALLEEPRVGTRTGKAHQQGVRVRLPSTASSIKERRDDDGTLSWIVDVPSPIHCLFDGGSVFEKAADGSRGDWAFSEMTIDTYTPGAVFSAFPYVIGFFREYLCDLDPNLKFNLVAIERIASAEQHDTFRVQGSGMDARDLNLTRPKNEIESIIRILENHAHMFVLRVPPAYQNDQDQAFCLLQIPADQWDRNRTLTPRSDLRGLCTSYLESFLWVLSYRLAAAHQIGAPTPEYDEFEAARNRLVAARLLFNVATAHLLNEPRWFHVLDTLIEISKMPYESRGAQGRIIFAAPDDPALDWVVRFHTPIALVERKRVRKLLEMASESYFIVSDTYNVYGLCQYSEQSSVSRPMVSTFGPAGTLAIGELDRLPLITIRDGDPVLPAGTLDLATLRKWLDVACPGTKETAVRLISEVAAGAARQGHGAAIVVCDDAADEARRLSTTGFPVVATALSRDAATCVSAIDGAILLDQDGVCHGVGVILDGEAAADLGSPTRGARFNSLARYVRIRQKRGHNCAALVISEDGPVSLFPELGSTDNSNEAAQPANAADDRASPARS